MENVELKNLTCAAIAGLALYASSQDLWMASNAYYMDEPTTQQIALAEFNPAFPNILQSSGCLCSGIENAYLFSGDYEEFLRMEL